MKLLSAIIFFALSVVAFAQSYPGKLPPQTLWGNPTASTAPAVPTPRNLTGQTSTIAGLQALSTVTYPNGVIKTGNILNGDDPPLFYTPTNTCLFTDNRATDNYHCIPSADGKNWQLDVPRGPIDPRDYGDPMDARSCFDIGSVTNAGVGGRIQISASGACSNFTGRTGELVKLYLAVDGPTVINTTIYSVQSSTVVTLASTDTGPASACNVVAGCAIYYGADSATYANAYINSQPINSTFTIQAPQDSLMLVGSSINFNARNVIFRGSASMLGGLNNYSQGNNLNTGTVIVPVFVTAPTPFVTAFYMPNTWGSGIYDLAIVGDTLYGRSFWGIVVAKDNTIPDSQSPSTFMHFDNLSIGAVNAVANHAGPNYPSTGLGGILASGPGAQSDRADIGVMSVTNMVHSVSFCGDVTTHPFACQAVEWNIHRLSSVFVYNPIDLSHGGGASIDYMESLSTGVDFLLADSATLILKDWGMENNNNYAPMGFPWQQSTVFPRNLVIWGTDNSFHLVTAFGTTGATEPTWSVSCPNVGDTCTDGSVTYKTIASPSATQFVAFGTGGNVAGFAYVTGGVFGPLVNYPAYGSPASAALSYDGGNFFFIAQNMRAWPSGNGPIFDLLQGAYFVCENCNGFLPSMFSLSAVGPAGACDARTFGVVKVTRPIGYPTAIPGDVGDDIDNFLPCGSTSVQAFRTDKLGAVNVLGGPLNMPQLSPPGTVYNLTPSSAGANTYGYQVSAVSGTGETPVSGALFQTVGSACTVGVAGCSIKGSFFPSAGADHYKIYRTVAGGALGTEQYALTVVANNSVNSYNFEDTVPDGSLGAAPPTKNTTGYAIIGGALTAQSGVRSGSSSNTDLTGRVTLGGGTGSYTLSQTYSSAPNCLCYDITTPANACSVSESTTALTFTGTGADVIKYICAGRNYTTVAPLPQPIMLAFVSNLTEVSMINVFRSAAILAAALVLSSASAAADLPSRKAAPAFVQPTPVIDWTGIYVGVQAGYGFGSKAIPLSYYQTGWQFDPKSIDHPLIPQFAPYEFGSGASAFVNTSGFFAGGVIGYNQQFGKFVVGVDADFNPRIAGHGQTATFALPTLGVYPSIATVGETWNWGSTIDGRAGYLVTPSLLLYARGGLALVQTSGHITTANIALLSSGYGTSGTVYSGWNVGGGVEYKLTPSISTKVQYTHIDVGSHTMRLSGLAWDAAGQQETQLYIGRIHPREDVVTVGVNFQLSNLLGNFPTLTK